MFGFQCFVCGSLLFVSLRLLICNPSDADGPVVRLARMANRSWLRRPAASAIKSPAEKSAEKRSPMIASKDGEKEKPRRTKSPEPKVIRRDETTKDESDPDELKAMVGEDGRVAFQFRNQPWVELVQWLADISDKPLDWLELPGDRVNMRSPGRYTVEETRDLFNRYLLARGYTLLEIDGGLTVAKTEKINPAIVPRVEVSELATLPPHTFVRTSLDVGWLSAEKLSEELETDDQQQWSADRVDDDQSNRSDGRGRQFAQVAQLLDQERNSASLRSAGTRIQAPLLAGRRSQADAGAVSRAWRRRRSTPLTPQQIQMMQQMRSQNKGVPPPEKKVEVSIVANARQNSVIIRAPADRVAIAMEFLKRVDVPSESMVSLADIRDARAGLSSGVARSGEVDRNRQRDEHVGADNTRSRRQGQQRLDRFRFGGRPLHHQLVDRTTRRQRSQL